MKRHLCLCNLSSYYILLIIIIVIYFYLLLFHFNLNPPSLEPKYLLSDLSSFGISLCIKHILSMNSHSSLYSCTLVRLLSLSVQPMVATQFSAATINADLLMDLGSNGYQTLTTLLGCNVSTLLNF